MRVDAVSGLFRPQAPGGVGANEGSRPLSFADMLDQFVQEVNQDQWAAKQANWRLVNGEAENLHDVVMAAEKAEVSFQLTLQMRNRIMEAYQEMMRMQV